MLAKLGVCSIEEFLNAEPFEMNVKLKINFSAASLNVLYAIIGAQQGNSWIEVVTTRRTKMLLTLDNMGLAPK